MVQQAEFHGVSVPYLPAIQIECEAEALLSAFAKRFSAITEPPVPAQEIASRLLGLRIESLDLKRAFPDSDAHGAIWFRQRKVAIDQSLDPRLAPANRFRYRFALAHELGRWQLHRRHYLENQTEQRLWERGLVGPDIVCRSKHRVKPIKWQADQFASLLLIPRTMLLQAWNQFRGGDSSPIDVREILPPGYAARRLSPGSSTNDDRSAMEYFCRPLADRFEVSAQAMRIRLESLQLFVRKRHATL